MFIPSTRRTRAATVFALAAMPGRCCARCRGPSRRRRWHGLARLEDLQRAFVHEHGAERRADPALADAARFDHG